MVRSRLASTLASPSSRRAWIEIRGSSLERQLRWVALLAEGVDRNASGSCSRPHRRPSPSSRRAWIEINLKTVVRQYVAVALLAEGVDRNRWKKNSIHGKWVVALLAEGVDRNFARSCIPPLLSLSPSSRRAWIEISSRVSGAGLRWRRPPRGGRG